MGILKKIKRHAAMACGDFRSLFKGAEIPPLPDAAHRLLTEINKPDPDIHKLVKLISASAGIAAKVIRTVNSSYFGLRQPVTDIQRAVMVLGLKNIRSLALAYATMEALPRPKDDQFDHRVYWTDSLLRAILARQFAQARFADQAEEAFTAALLADIALPVLLAAWGDYYAPVIAEWRRGGASLSRIERSHFGWDHAQAGAWIVRSWGFPDDMTCYIGGHNLTLEEIDAHDLADTLVVPVSLANRFAGMLKADEDPDPDFLAVAAERLWFPLLQMAAQMKTIAASFDEILHMFGLADHGLQPAMDRLSDAIAAIPEEAA